MKKAAVQSILVAVVLLALGVIAEAQQAKKVPLLGYLSSLDPARESTLRGDSAGCYVDVKPTTYETSFFFFPS
jgi:hypothetical protein